MSKKPKVFLELNLKLPAKKDKTSALRLKPHLELFRVIGRAADDKKIDGILLNLASYEADRTSLWELRGALERFKETGKKVCAFLSDADLDLYCLATVADKIIMDDLGVLNLLGYSWGRNYLQKTLKKLGIGVTELRYFKYKSALDSFVRDSLSKADREQYGEILDAVMEITRDAVIKARSLDTKEFNAIINNELMLTCKPALDRGLVDFSGREKAVLEAVKEMFCLKTEVSSIDAGEKDEKLLKFVIYGDYESSLSRSKHIYKPKRTRKLFFRPKEIAVIYANGVCDMKRGIKAWALANMIREIAEKKRIKAIVLRLNTPGGSAEASDFVTEAIKKARERIPVVVSMGSVAASGGYWISMAASHICASALTLTGSIGVIASWFYDKGLSGKLGLKNDSIQRGDHADLMSGALLPNRDLKKKEEARFRELILGFYDDFTARVAANRNKTREEVEALAQGRVFSGLAAQKLGLVDSIGGLDEAIRVARKLAKIPENKKIAYCELPKIKFTEKIKAQLSQLDYDSKLKQMAELFIPETALEELHYRMQNSGSIMPIMPLGCMF